MLRSDILEAIDYSLKKNGNNPNKPFGGKQILFVGDIFQLPPVNSVEKFDAGLKAVFQASYKSPYFFDAPAYTILSPKYFEFKIPHRQKNDLEFVGLLDKVRICEIDESTLNKLNEKYSPNYVPKDDEFVINLTLLNKV